MCLLILVGLSLEMSNSWWRVGLVYTIGVISGSLGTAIIKPGTYLAGASGLLLIMRFKGHLVHLFSLQEVFMLWLVPMLLLSY